MLVMTGRSPSFYSSCRSPQLATQGEDWFRDSSGQVLNIRCYFEITDELRLEFFILLTEMHAFSILSSANRPHLLLLHNQTRQLGRISQSKTCSTIQPASLIPCPYLLENYQLFLPTPPFSPLLSQPNSFSSFLSFTETKPSHTVEPPTPYG